jgi:hippurate hydrolase
LFARHAILIAVDDPGEYSVNTRFATSAFLLLTCLGALADPVEIEAEFPHARQLYVQLHQNPELSGAELSTAARLSSELRTLGYTVSENIAGHGLVAVLNNGAGRTIMLRSELDALPIEEKTGLAYASKVASVAHMCGHDLHMAAMVGTAAIMAKSRGTWRGTLMLVAQPAEETISGAQAMVKEGLFERFGRPDAVLALHVGNDLPAGKVGVVAGNTAASSDAFRVVLYGKGGHGSMPHTTIDPVLMAARSVEALEMLPGREVRSGDVAVLSVGYIHAGSKNNVIPDDAEMGFTLRTYSPDVRRKMLDSIARVINAQAQMAGATRAPLIDHGQSTPAVYNDPALAARMRVALEAALGKDNVVTGEAQSASDDFAEFVGQGIPGFFMFLGGANPDQLAAARKSGTGLPSNHSPFFAPDVDPALRTAISAEVALLRSLLMRVQ